MIDLKQQICQILNLIIITEFSQLQINLITLVYFIAKTKL